MKILLCAVNACYNHTNLAVRSICHYVDRLEIVNFGEWTINQNVQDILRGIASHNPDVVLFSTYIWNAEIVQKLICDVKKILPKCVIGAGGPEVGFYAEGYLKKLSSLDFVMCGEGEATVDEIVCIYEKLFGACNGDCDFDGKLFLENIKTVSGIYTKLGDEIFFGKNRELIQDLSDLPFAYPQITDPDNRIYYYESSRGCPFSCSYCMSSLDKRVRFMPLERVFEDIQRFLDANVRLVKFVDRTYNLQSKRYIAIWEYILAHHNGKTMFHFEIEAEFLDEEALVFLQKVPAGVMQFEIGVQSSNKKTLEAVGRSCGTEKLAENIKRIPRTIHSHLDLIAGLPFEDLESFGKSFDFTMALKPDALQLGFLKVLHGTNMEQFAIANNWKWMENPPYETFSTPYMSYDDMMFLKDVETLVDAYWNSEAFENTMNYIGKIFGFWNFFSKLAGVAKKQNVFDVPHKETFWFEYLAGFVKDCHDEQSKVVYELLRFDFIRSGKKGGFPEWYKHNYDKEAHRA
ncbi:MAG: DUF4080 domain-containing protein, partial [Treponema sp.]|nr:DUF4080 domain-containing protein [Treponema sp.]